MKYLLLPPLLMFYRSLLLRFQGYTAKGNDILTITKNTISDCYVTSSKYKGFSYMRVSSGHFKQFYIRDFGMIIESLIDLGYRKEAFSTLQYAFFVYNENDAITTTISSDKPVNFFSFSTDSLPFLLRSLRIAIEHGFDKAFVDQYALFLQKQITLYVSKVYDSKTHLVKKGHFSTIKDNYKRTCSTYDVSCLLAVHKEVQRIHSLIKKQVLKVPFSYKKSKQEFIKQLWNSKKGFFYDDLDKAEYVTSDAQIFPFYFSIITDDDMKKRALSYLPALSKDYPIQYASYRDTSKELLFGRFLAPNYEGTTYWLHLGLCYLTILDEKKELRRNLLQVKNMILQYKTFIEVFTSRNIPYRSLTYHADEGISWIAGYTALLKKERLL